MSDFYRYFILRLLSDSNSPSAYLNGDEGYLVVRCGDGFLLPFLKDHVTILDIMDSVVTLQGVYPQMVRYLNSEGFKSLLMNDELEFVDNDQFGAFQRKDTSWAMFRHPEPDYLFEDQTMDFSTVYVPYKVTKGVMDTTAKIVFNPPMGTAKTVIEDVIDLLQANDENEE